MDLGIRGKVAIVTGASEGIGKAIAMKLAEEGARVGLCSRRKDKIDFVGNEIGQFTNNKEILAFAGDMSNMIDVEIFIKTVIAKWSTVHILVNNVGRAHLAFFKDLSMEDWSVSLAVNLNSAIYTTDLVLPHMRKQKWGRIINIASVTGKEPGVGLMASNAAKSALISFSKTLAAEVARDGILVNCICPGRILSAQTLRLHSKEEIEKMASALIPAGRFGTPEEVGSVVAFLASECASYISGTAISVDGGMARGIF